MEARPKVSVLIPVYNTKEEYLRGMIDSVIAQTFTDFEILIVNDASTDSNVERIVLSYSDPRIRYFTNPENLGISGTRNRLIDLARGEYLAITDHDDISLPERFEKEVEYLDANPEVGVVGSFIEILKSKKRIIAKYPQEDFDIRLAIVSGFIPPLTHPVLMIRKSVFDESGVRYEAQFSPTEDYALYCRLLPHTQFHNLPEILLQYRWHDTNTSRLQCETLKQAKLAIQCMVRSENPVLYDMYRESATHVTKVKLFGFIPFLKIIRRGERCICTVFGIPLFRSKIQHAL